MKKINILVIAAMLTNKVYASRSNQFFRSDRGLGNPSQNNQNRNNENIDIDGTIFQSSPNNNVSATQDDEVYGITFLLARQNRVEYTEYFMGNLVLLRFMLNFESSELIDNFPRSLIRDGPVGRLMNIPLSEERHQLLITLTRGISLANYDIDGFFRATIISDIQNVAAIRNEIALERYIFIENENGETRINANNIYRYATQVTNSNLMSNLIIRRDNNIRHDEAIFRNRVSLFIDRNINVAEFLLRTDVEMSDNDRNGMEILSNLLENLRRRDVIDRLRNSGFFNPNAHNMLNAEEVIRNRNNIAGSISLIRNLGQNLSNSFPNNVHPEDNPVTGTSIDVDSSNREVIIRAVAGSNDRNTILTNILTNGYNYDNIQIVQDTEE